MKTSKPKLDAEYTRIANTPSEYRKRVETIGFKFGYVRVEKAPPFPGLRVKGTFECLCGRKERYTYFVSDLIATPPRLAFDVAYVLDSKYGSFSRQHLLDDGYSETAVDEIMAKAERVCQSL